MNSVNLVGWVLHTCRDDVLWNPVCYPLLPLTLEPLACDTPPPPTRSPLSPFPVPPLPPSVLFLPLIRPVSLISLHLECFEPETKQAASPQEAAASAEICPVSSPSLLPAPTFSSFQSSTIYTVHSNVNPLPGFCMQHSWDPLPRTEETLFASTRQFTFNCIVRCLIHSFCSRLTLSNKDACPCVLPCGLFCTDLY